MFMHVMPMSRRRGFKLLVKLTTCLQPQCWQDSHKNPSVVKAICLQASAPWRSNTFQLEIARRKWQLQHDRCMFRQNTWPGSDSRDSTTRGLRICLPTTCLKTLLTPETRAVSILYRSRRAPLELSSANSLDAALISFSPSTIISVRGSFLSFDSGWVSSMFFIHYTSANTWLVDLDLPPPPSFEPTAPWHLLSTNDPAYSKRLPKSNLQPFAKTRLVMATEPTQTQNSVVYDSGQRVGVAVSVFAPLPLGPELNYGPVRCYLWPLFPSRSLVYPSGKSYFSLCLRTAYEPLLVQTTPEKNFQEHTHVWLFHVPAIIQYFAGFRCCDEFRLAGNWPSGCGSILHGSGSVDTIRESRDGDVVCFCTYPYLNAQQTSLLQVFRYLDTPLQWALSALAIKQSRVPRRIGGRLVVCACNHLGRSVCDTECRARSLLWHIWCVVLDILRISK